MPTSNFTQSSFLGGEWSAFAQGRTDLPTYRQAMAVCRNGLPTEEGAWVRRSGGRFAATTLNGAAGRCISLAFEQAAPYVMEFTDGKLRFYAVSTQTSGLTTPLPADFRLVTTNDNQQVLSISTANPAVVQTGTHTWATGDQVQFLFATTVNAGFTPLLRARVFKITVTDSTHFSIADPLTGANIDGSTLGWSAPVANTVIVVRMLAMTTPYISGGWSTVRKIQAEKQAVLLHSNYLPQNLKVVTDPTASAFATFSLAPVAFIDGPYLDPPIDGTVITPNVVPTQGTLPVSATWSGIASNGSLFVSVAINTAIAATSPDGKTWTQRVLPVSALWSSVAWNGTVFCAVSGGTSNIAATSPDGITWTQRTLPTSANWFAIAVNVTTFCAIANGSSIAATSADGITWTQRVLPVSTNWSAITANGTIFVAVSGNSTIAATSPDGITWTQRALPVSDSWSGVSWNGTVFCAIAGIGVASAAAATSPDGITWTQRALPSVSLWQAIAWSGSLFCIVTNGSGVDATSPDGIAWTQHIIPAGVALRAIAWGSSTFCAVGSSNISEFSATGVFGIINLTASSLNSINKGQGFLSTDVGRSIRLLSEPLPWFIGTAYVAGNSVKFNGIYFTAIASSTGKQPDISPTSWTISTAAATWTWGIINTVISTSVITIIIQGPDLLYTNPIPTWRLAVYSDTTGYPTCGVYYEGRLWVSGAVPNRVDASMSNQIFNMAPTAADGTVAGNNAISYTLNSDDVNPIFWMVGTSTGILAGTQEGEWVIVAPTTGPITPTNIAARRSTTYGSANIEPQGTQLTTCFVQRFNRQILEYFPDALSGRYTAPNLAQNAKHLTIPGISEIRYQQETSPIIWSRKADGTISGTTYERESLFSSQPAKFVGWHRHDWGSGRTTESITVGPSVDGSLDTLVMVTNDPATNIRHVELLNRIYDVGIPITSGWFCDDAVVPSGGVITSAGVNSTLTFYGLWHLNGKTVTVSCGGVDVGDFAVANGQVTMPIDAAGGSLFTSTYLLSISSTTAYGAMGTPIEWSGGRLTVPAVVGFTYTSQGQILRPDMQEQTRSPTGPGLAKPRRLHQFGALLSGTQGISFGTSFAKLHPALFKSAGGTVDLTNLQLFSGIYWSAVDDTWGFDSQLCWQVSRPYPATVVALDGFMQMTDR